MKNRFLIGGLALLLIAALIVSASAADVISVSELFNFGGDTQEEVTAEISDVSAGDTSAPEETAPAPVQEPAAEDNADSNTDPVENPDETSDNTDSTGDTSDNNTTENTDNTDSTDNTDNTDTTDSAENNDSTDPGVSDDGQADTPDATVTDATGEMGDVSVPAQNEVITDYQDDSHLVIHISNESTSVVGGTDNSTTDIPTDIPTYMQTMIANCAGIIVEVPIYISGSNANGGPSPLVTNANIIFNPSFRGENDQSIGDSGIFALPPIVGEAFEGSITSTESGMRTTVTYANTEGVVVGESAMPFITLRFCIPAELVSGRLTIGVFPNTNIPGYTGQSGARDCFFYGYASQDFEGDTFNFYSIMSMDRTGWQTPSITLTHEHVVNNWTVTTAPTCTTDGVETGTCTSTRCPNHSEDNALTRPVTMLEHNFTSVSRQDATCTEDGHIAYKYCDKCDRYFDPDDTDLHSTNHLTKDGVDYTADDVVIDALGHDFETVPYQVPTCSAEGHIEHQICNRDCCEGLTFDMDGNQYQNHEEILEIDPTNHVDPLTEIPYVEPNCHEGSVGRNQYWHCDHCDKYFKDAAGTPGQETTVADEVIPNDHLFETVPAVEQDCHIDPETGTGRDAVAEHQICTRDCCDGLVYDMDGQPTTMEDLTTPFTHKKPADPAEIETVAPTGTEDGYIRYVCVDCGETITEIIPATGIIPNSGSGRYAPNTDDGSSPALWVILIVFGLALAGLTIVTAGRRKYNR